MLGWRPAIANPYSKRGTIAELESRFGVSIALSKVYRMMDRLMPEVLKKIERSAWRVALRNRKPSIGQWLAARYPAHRA